MLCGCAWFSTMSLLSSSLGKEGLPWQTLALVRSSVAFALALVIALALGVRLVAIGPRALWLRSLAGSCSMLSTFFALANLHASEVLTLTNTFPVWVALLSWPMVGEKPSRGVWVAVLIAVCGVSLAVYPREGDTSTTQVFRLAPALSAVGASMFTALAMLGLNKLRAIEPMAIVVHFSGVSMIFCAAAMFVFPFRDGPDPFESWEMTVRVLGIGVTAMVGQIFLTLAFSRGTATKIAVVGLSQVAMVMAVEVIFGWKWFTPMNMIGTLLILGPTAWLMMRERKVKKPVTEPVAIE